jgi:hypothetical protein
MWNEYFLKKSKKCAPEGSGCLPTWKTGNSGKTQGIIIHSGIQGKLREFFDHSGNF